MKEVIKSIFICLLVCNYTSSVAQFRNINWCFGDSAGIDFKTSSPTTFVSSVKSRGSCASISDSAGNLLFYAFTRATLPGNTTFVYDANHQLMQNGDNIVGRGWYQELVILPDPGDTNKYYLFSVGVTSIFGLYYSVIDMSQNNGLGAVIQKNVQLLTFAANDGLAAVKHGNGRDWWVIFKRYDIANADFYKYLISPSGIAGPFVQTIGAITSSNTIRHHFSTDGQSLSAVSYRGLIETFRFNRCTGVLYNNKLIKPENTSSPFPEYADGEFSPSGRYLYVASSGFANNSELFQLDLQDSLPLNSADTLFSTNFPIVTGGGLKLATDGKIYWSCAWYDGINNNYPYPDTTFNIYNTYLSVINKPDSAGTACDFQPYSFYLGGARTYWGLPNNPNYELKADSGSICDSLTVGISEYEYSKLNAEMYVFYNPDWQTAFINAKGLRGNRYALTVVDVLGHIVYKEDGKLDGQYYTHDLHMPGFADGLYIVSLVTDKEVLSRKFVR